MTRALPKTVLFFTVLLSFFVSYILAQQARPSDDRVISTEPTDSLCMDKIAEFTQVYVQIGDSKRSSPLDNTGYGISQKHGPGFFHPKHNLALVVVKCQRERCTNGINNQIISSGGTILAVFPPHIIIVEISEELKGSLLKNDEIEGVFTSEIEPSQIPYAEMQSKSGVEFWNKLKTGRSFEKATGLDISPIENDVLPHPLPSELRESFGRGQSDSLTGSIDITVIFPESDGSIDPNIENWTTNMKINVMDEIIDACSWWESMNPLENVSFTVSYLNPAYCGTGYEPINRPHTDEPLWVNQIMDNLGVPWALFHTWRVATWNEWRRSGTGADWAYTIFVVNSDNDPDGMFFDNWFAYAYYGGPFVVMTYDNDDYGIQNMDAVCAHESGHIFWATDEYWGADPQCNDNSDCNGWQHNGFPNANCEFCNSSPVGCIMRGQVFPFSQRRICYFTQGHIGWTPRPFPDIRFPLYDDLIALGEYSDITVWVENVGGNSTNGGISISFPGFTGGGDGSHVSLQASSGDAPGYNVFPAGTLIGHKDGYQFAAYYLLAEWSDNNWQYNEENYVTLRVWPQQPGTFEFYVRSAMGLNSVYFNYPTIPDCYDQQGWEVWRFTISVMDQTPPSPNPMTWSTEPYEISASAISMVATTASDPSTPIYYYFDFYDSPTGGSGGTDGDWTTSTSYTDGGLQTNHQYGYRVKAKDSASPANETGYSSPVSYDYTDIETPVGISFCDVANNFIEARSSNTPSGLTRGSSGLRIENVTNGDNSGWKQNNDCWTSSGLVVNTRYGFRAQARNGDADPTPWSDVTYMYTLSNQPGAASFSNVTNSSIQANWTHNGNPSGTEYLCQNVTKETNSGWITNTYWVSDGLFPNNSYTFRVKSRNGNWVESGWTPLGSKYTLANTPSAPIVSNPTQTTLDVDVQPNGNPSPTQFAIYNNTVGYYIRGDGGNNGATPVWQTDATWGVKTVTGLSPNTEYCFIVKARNVENIETSFSSPGCGTTSSGNYAPVLSWTGEPNYVSDGLHPETGNSSTDYTYRVKYTDSDNNAPKSGYPKVHILKGGVEISGTPQGNSPFTMNQVDPGDVNYADGKLYTFTKNGLPDGTDYTYYFEAYDINDAPASGDPITPVDAPDVSTTSYLTVTVTTNVGSGTTVRINGVEYDAPKTFNDWPSGEARTISVDSPQSAGTDKRYVYSSWSDGGAQSHSVAPTTDTTYTADLIMEWKPSITLNGTDAEHTVSVQYTKDGTYHDESGKYGSWSDWCDDGTELNFSQFTTGTPPRFTTDQHSWTVNSAFSATINYTEQPECVIYVDSANTSGIEDGSWDHPFNTIQEGLDAASEVCTVLVAKGTYYERVTVSKHGVSLMGAGPGVTILKQSSNWSVIESRDMGPQTEITGFTVTRADTGAPPSCGIMCRSSSPQISYNLIFNVGKGIGGEGSSEPRIINNTIYGCLDYSAISFAYLPPGEGSPVITNNVIFNNGQPYVHGILWNETVTPIISYNDVYKPGGSWMEYAYCCPWTEVDGGEGAVSADPLFVDADGGDFRLQWGSPCIDAGDPDPMYNDPDGTRNDMGAFYYQGGSWAEDEYEERTISGFSLLQNYPNPFNPETIIEYQIPTDGQITLEIYDILGRRIRKLFDGYADRGRHRFTWDGKDDNGTEVSNGLYFYRIKAGQFSDVKKMVLLK